tara:strand:- start:1477 stop:1650 length:174 start_codon:yes stop_codon:yes gene_type:complete
MNDVNPQDIQWDIRDTEFLMRLLMSAKIDGQDIETAATVVKKIKQLHSKLIGHKVPV